VKQFMLFIKIIISILLISEGLSAQKITEMTFDGAYQFSEGRAVVMVNGKYGVIDIEGNYIAEPKYDAIGDYHGSYANVKLNGKWGYIDSAGNIVIPIKYEYASIFSEGLAAVQIGGKYGFIDSLGKVVIAPKYEYCYFFSEGLAGVVINGNLGFINRNGELVIEAVYNIPKWTKDGMLAYTPSGIYGDTPDFPQRVQAISLGGKWGYINDKGKIVYPDGFRSYNDLPSVFNNGVASIKRKGRAGFIDKTGKEIIPFDYSECSNFNEGYAIVRNLDKRGIIDSTGKVVIPMRYDNLFIPTEGLSVLVVGGGDQFNLDQGAKYGFINIQGDKVISRDYDHAMPFHEGLSAVIKGSKLGFIDKAGNVAIPLKYESRSDTGRFFTSFVDGLAPVKEDGKYKYIKHPFAVEKIKETVIAFGKFVGKVKEVKNNEIYITGKDIGTNVTIGTVMMIDSGKDKITYIRSLFPMLTMAKCKIITGSIKDVKPGSNVYITPKQQ